MNRRKSLIRFARALIVFWVVFFVASALVYTPQSPISSIPTAKAAEVVYVGTSNIIATDGTAPGAITPHTATVDGDLLVFYHYSRATGGNETVTLPTGFTSVFNSVTASQGLVAVGYRIRQAGDSTHTAQGVTNHATGTSGEAILEWIESYRNFDTANPIVNFTASLSTWASSTNIGSIAAPATDTVTTGDVVVVFGGRMENVTAQTTLTGNNLTWSQATRGDTTSGSDAGAVTQYGVNDTGTNQTVTAKTITTTGTAQAGAGRMFIIQKGAIDAVRYIGTSNLIATDGTAPGAITPHTATNDGDLLVFFHYSRATGGNETVTLPTGFTSVFNSVTANQGLVAVGYRIRQSGDTTHTAQGVTNHTTGTSGEAILEWIETYRDFDTANPIVNFTASLSTWASSTNIGSIAAPATATVTNGDGVVVFGGRMENVTAQTTLTGDSLTWSQSTRGDTSNGLDAGAVTQYGVNLTGSNQTVSAKTITTTGTAQAGAGRMFIIQRVPPTISISGTCDAYDQTTDCTDVGDIRVAVGGTLQGQLDATTDGSWEITGVSLPSTGAIITVFIDNGAGSDADEAVAVTKYDGSGAITGIKLFKEHLTIGSDDNQTITAVESGSYDNGVSSNENIFFDYNTSGLFTCDGSSNFTGLCTDFTGQFSNTERIYIGAGDTFSVGSARSAKLQNEGTLEDDGGGAFTITASGTNGSRPFINNGTFTFDAIGVTYVGDGDTTIEAVTYFDLRLDPTITSNRIYTLPAGTLTVNGLMRISPGAASSLSLTVNLGGITNVADDLYIQSTGSATSLLDTTGSNHGLTVQAINLLTSGTLQANNSTITLTGSDNNPANGTPFHLSGGTFNAGGSTVVYNTTTATKVAATTYHNLSLTPAGTVTYTLGTAASQTLNVGGDWTVGDGTNALTVNQNTYNIVINVTGNTVIAASGVLNNGSGNINLTGNLTVNGTIQNGSQTITINGNFTGTGTVNHNNVVEMRASSGKNFGTTSGANNWIVSTLTLSNSNAGATPVTFTTQSGGSGTITFNFINIGKSGDATGATTTLDASNRTWQTGATNPITLLTSPAAVFNAGTSTFNYTETLNNRTVSALTYYNLGVGTTSDSSSGRTFTLAGNSVVQNLLTIGHASSDNADTLSTSGSNYSLAAGSINITSKGALTANGSTITITGSTFTNDGTFTAGTSTVQATTTTALTFTTSNSTSTTFNNFIISGIGGAKTVKFRQHSSNVPLYTFAGTVTLAGASGQLITIDSENGTNPWLVHFNSSQTGSWLHLTRSACNVGSATISISNSTDNGSNGACWNFVTGITISGTTNTGNILDVKVAVNGTLAGQTGSSDGLGGWSISNVGVNSGEVIVVWYNGVDNSEESTAVAKYDGTGDMTGIVLNVNVLSIGSGDNQSLTLTNLDLYDCANDEDVMYRVNSGTLEVQGAITCEGSVSNSYTGETLRIESGDTLTVSGTESVTTEKVNNAGTYTHTSSGTLTLSGSGAGSSRPLINTGTFTLSSGTVAYTGTSALDVSNTTSDSITYNHLSLIPAAAPTYTLGTASSQTMNIDGDWVIGNGSNAVAVNHNTYDPAILIAGNFTFTSGSGGSWTTSNSATITLKPTGTKTLTNTNGRNLGIVSIASGSSTPRINISGNVYANTWTVASGHLLDLGSGNLTVYSSGTGASKPFNVTSSTFSASTGSVYYQGNANTDIAPVDYYNLFISPDNVTYPSIDYNFQSAAVTSIGNNFTVTSGNFSTGFEPVYLNVNLSNNLSITGSLSIGGSEVFIDPDTFTANSVLNVGSHSLSAASIAVNTFATLNAGSGTITVTGSGTPFTRNGTFTPGTSTFVYNSTSATNITSTTYNHLSLTPAGAVTYTLGTAGSQTINTNNFTIGNGTNALAVQHATWDPAINITGNLTLNNNLGTFTKSDAGTPAVITLSPSGTKIWTDHSVTKKDIGIVAISGGSASPRINLATPVTVTKLSIASSHQLDFNGANTLTLTGSGTTTARPFINSGTFTPSSGTVAFTGTSASEIESTTYNHLSLIPAGTVTYTLGTASSQTMNVSGDLTVGNGTNALTATAVTNDPVINVTGNTIVAVNSTLTRGSGLITFTGDFTVNGTFNGTEDGTVNATGNVVGSGTISMNGCSICTLHQRVSSGKNFGSTSGIFQWSFTVLKFSNSNGSATPVTITTQSGGTGEIRMGSYLEIGDASDASGATTTLDSANRTWEFTSNGNPVRVTSTKGILTANTSTFDYIHTSGAATTVTAATYYNLGIGTRSGSGTAATFTLDGNTTVSNTLTIGTASSTRAASDVLNTSAASNYSLSAANINITSKGALTANGSTITITGSGTPFTQGGTFTPGTSTVVYNSTSATNITSTTYNHLSLTPAGSVTYTLGTAGSQSITANNLTLGNGTNALAVQHATWDPEIVVTGNLSLANNLGTFTKSDAGTPAVITLSPAGTKTWSDSNATKKDIGIVAISGGTSTPRINLSTSVTVTKLSIASSHQLDFNGSNTLTLTGSGATTARPFINSGTFTPSSGTVAFTGTSASEIESTTYNHLSLIPAGTVTYTLGTASSQTINVSGDLTVGNGTNALTATAQTHDPIINVTGNTTVGASAIFRNGTGAWNFTGDLAVNGTLSTGDINTTTVNGNITGSGTVNKTTGNFVQRVSSDKTFGSTSGSNDWIFSTLRFSNSNGTATPISISANSGGSGAFYALTQLIIGDFSDTPEATTTLQAGSRIWNLGSDISFSGGMGLLTANTSTFNYISSSFDVNVAAATYYNLGVGTNSDGNTGRTFTIGGNTTVQNLLTIGNASSDNSDILDTSSGSNYSLSAGSINITSKGALTANNSTITITGSGTPFTQGGTFTPGGSTVVYNSTSATNITSTTYNHLSLTPAGSVTYTLGTAGSQTINTNNFTIGNGTNAVAVNHATWDPAINITGDFLIAANTGTFTKSDAGTPAVITFKKGGIQTWTDNSPGEQTIGVVQVSANGGNNTTLNLGSNVEASRVIIDSAQTFSLNGTRTLTLNIVSGTGSSRPFQVNGTFTPSTGTVMYNTNSSSTSEIEPTTYYNLTLTASGPDAINRIGTAIDQTLIVDNDFIVSAQSTLDADTYDPTIELKGLNNALNISSASTVWTKGSGLVKFNRTSGTQTWSDISTNKQDVGNVQISSTTILASDVKATSITVDSGKTFSTNGARTVTLTGNGTPIVNNGGTVTLSSGSTVEFASAATTGTTVPALTYHHLKVNKASNTFTAASGTLTVGGNLDVTAGSLDLNANDPTTNVTGNVTIAGTLSAPSVTGNPLTVGGNLTNNGTFTHNNGKVVAGGATSTTSIINGSANTDFYDFSSTVQNKTIKFKADNDFGFAGTLTITGTVGNYINLYSDTPGTRWNAAVTGSVSLSYLRLWDAGCAAGGNNIILPETAVDVSNNNPSCWKFIGRGGGNGPSGGGSGSSGAEGGGGSGGGGGGSGGSGGSSDLPQTFTAANGTALTSYNSNWSLRTSSLINGNFAINSNQVHSNVVESFAAWNGTFSADQFAEITITAVSSGNYIGVAVRLQNQYVNGYVAWCSSDNIQIARYESDEFSDSSGNMYSGSACSVNDIIRLEITGSTLTLKRNGITLTSITDSTFATGIPGLSGSGTDTTTRGDNWTAGSNVTGGGGGGSP